MFLRFFPVGVENLVVSQHSKINCSHQHVYLINYPLTQIFMRRKKYFSVFYVKIRQQRVLIGFRKGIHGRSVNGRCMFNVNVYYNFDSRFKNIFASLSRTDYTQKGSHRRNGNGRCMFISNTFSKFDYGASF